MAGWKLRKDKTPTEAPTVDPEGEAVLTASHTAETNGAAEFKDTAEAESEGMPLSESRWSLDGEDWKAPKEEWASPVEDEPTATEETEHEAAGHLGLPPQDAEEMDYEDPATHRASRVFDLSDLSEIAAPASEHAAVYAAPDAVLAAPEATPFEPSVTTFELPEDDDNDDNGLTFNDEEEDDFATADAAPLTEEQTEASPTPTPAAPFVFAPMETMSALAEPAPPGPAVAEPVEAEPAAMAPAEVAPVEAARVEAAPLFAIPIPEPEDADETDTFNTTAQMSRAELASAYLPPPVGSGIPSVAPFILDVPAAPPPASETAHQLVVRVGRLSATFDLGKEVVSIGRPDSNLHYYPDVEIEMDDAVSRRHAEILKRDDGYYLVDTGSTNGTLLNGEKLPPHDERLLAHGDRIRVGERTEIIFE